jgi:CheY-like chemotaxis protein
MKILIVEDDLNKLNNLKNYINIYFNEKNLDINLSIKHSFQSGLEDILTNTYDLLLLDMSLPNFDFDEHNDMGVPLSKGGELILYEMDVMGININTIIVTQYDGFDDESLEDINENYKRNFSSFYKGYVFYNAIESNWQKDLEIILDGVLNNEYITT